MRGGEKGRGEREKGEKRREKGEGRREGRMGKVCQLQTDILLGSNQWHLGGMSWLSACKERSDRYSFQQREGRTTHQQGGATQHA